MSRDLSDVRPRAETRGSRGAADPGAAPPPPRAHRLDDVMRALREDVRRRAGRSVEPGGAAGGDRRPVELTRVPVHSALRDERPLHVRDLLAHDDESFVIHAYRAILGRDPDGEGWSHCLIALRTGAQARLEILGRLRYSKEGRRRRARIVGLLPRFGIHMVGRIPILGPFLIWPIAVLRLPVTLRALEAAEARRQHLASERAHAANRALDRIEAELASLPEQLRQRVDAALLIHPLAERVDDLVETQRDVAEQVGALEGRAAEAHDLEQLVGRVDGLATRLGRLDDRIPLIDRVPLLSEAVAAQERTAADRKSVEALQTALVAITGEAGRPGRLDEIESRLRAALEQAVAETKTAISTRQDSVDQRVAQLAADAASRETARTDLEKRVRDRIEPKVDVLESATFGPESARLAGEYGPLWTELYAKLEDRFRGDREEIAERLRVYLPRARAAIERCGDDTCVDLGCGRGEWLGLVREAGWRGLGVDCNDRMARTCEALDLTVEVADTSAFLREREADSVGVVTAFHLLEHLPLDELLGLLVQSHRVLRPGGIAIFETPNPENLVVGACNFYTDPSHRNPLYPATLAFVLEQCGFEEVEIVRPTRTDVPGWLEPLPDDDPAADRLNPLFETLRLWFTVSPDFAVVGRKP